MKFTVTLPLPPRELMPNRKSHWAVKMRKVKQYRRDAAWAAIKSMTEGGIRYNVEWTAAIVRIHWYANKKTFVMPDKDNIIASLKSALDGLQDAKMLANDYDVDCLVVSRQQDAKNPRVELEVEQSKDGK